MFVVVAAALPLVVSVDAAPVVVALLFVVVGAEDAGGDYDPGTAAVSENVARTCSCHPVDLISASLVR